MRIDVRGRALCITAKNSEIKRTRWMQIIGAVMTVPALLGLTDDDLTKAFWTYPSSVCKIKHVIE